MRLATLLLVGLLEVVSCQQWVVHNITTHVVNTTSVQAPGYGWHPPVHNIGPVRNATYYANPQNGFVNVTRALHPSPGQVLVFSQSYFKPAKFLRVREQIVQYPIPNFVVPYNRLITAIKLIDVQGKGNGRILQGGIGRNSVTIRLQSQRGEPLNFVVFIYGV